MDDSDTGNVQFDAANALRIDMYINIIDNMSAQLSRRFPDELTDFAFLQPINMQAIEGEQRIQQLAERYQTFNVDPDRAINQWRLSRHLFADSSTSTSLSQTCSRLPEDFNDLRILYRIGMTLPVTTAGVERAFFKLCNLKTKLRSTMSQDRLEALMLATVEKDILLSLSTDDLVSQFANSCDRRLELR